MAVPRAPLYRNFHAERPRKVLAGKALFYLHHFFGSTRRYDSAAVNPCARAEVYNIVGDAEGLLVMLYDNERISKIAQIQQGVDKALVIPLMQADGRFVQNIQYPD